MTNQALGRTELAILTNKSGGSVAQGDVVIVDAATASSFTTTTTGAYVSGRIGVVWEVGGIANNASGLVAFGGYVPKLNLASSASLGHLVKTHTVAKQGTPHGAPQVAGDFAQVLATGTSPAALLFGTVQLGSGAGVGYTEGTSFPGSPSTNDKYYRTDRNLLYYYDGTRWLTVDLYVQIPTTGDGGAPPYAASAAPGYFMPDPTYGMYLVDFQATIGVFGTNNGTNYWTVEIFRRNAANTNNSITSFNTSADTPSNWVQHSVSINAVLDASAKVLGVLATKVLSPASLYVTARLTYRLIG